MTSDLRIAWLDPSLDSRNVGDEIISEAVGLELHQLFPGSQIVRVPTQRFLRVSERKAVASADIAVVGGTNLLNGNIPRYLQWKIDPHAIALLAGKTAVMGVGWWQYQSRVNAFSRQVWKFLAGAPNSVRDEYTRTKLADSGVHSRNTGCPTTWSVAPEVSFTGLRDAVLTTITDYNRAPERDSKMFAQLRKYYGRVVVWPQGRGDHAYIRGLGPDVEFLAPGLTSFDQALSSGEFDYFGTRLHAGVRALQMGVRSTVVAIDNRANEMGRDIGLPTISTEMRPEEFDVAMNRSKVSLQIPHGEISEWRRDLRAWAYAQLK